jgi:hypothetical protein
MCLANSYYEYQLTALTWRRKIIMFPPLKQKFMDDPDSEIFVRGWLIAQDTDLYQQEKEKLFSRFEKCLS